MSVTLLNLRDAVNDELENHPMTGSAEVTGDGSSAAFLVAPVGCYIVSGTTFKCYIDDVLTSAYTMDYDSGVCTMTAVPATTNTVSWSFTYVRWPNALVNAAINAAIDQLFPSLYVRSSAVQSCDSSTYEYDAPVGSEVVTRVDYSTSATGPWKRQAGKRYEVVYDAGAPVVRLFTAPSGGSLRLHYVARPANLTTDSDSLEATALLPARAKDPIVSYACYHLLVQKMAPRVRTDVAVTTQNAAAVLPSQMQYGHQAFLWRFQFQLASMKMPPWQLG